MAHLLKLEFAYLLLKIGCWGTFLRCLRPFFHALDKQSLQKGQALCKLKPVIYGFISLKQLDQNKLYFLPLGGCGEIGMNLNLYHYKGRWIMVDLGISFDRSLGVEVIMPDIKALSKHNIKVDALLVTHGHEDHIGAIPYLYENFMVPIYATPFTAFLIREKLKDVNMLSKAEIIEVSPLENIDLDPFNISYIPITHSIPESHVLKIKTDAGTIVHTGDWKYDRTPVLDQTNTDAMEALAQENPIALVCDSTNVFEEGESGSELEVRNSLIDLIGAQDQRVVVTCFASNVARLLTCVEAAQKADRKVVLSGRSLWRMVDAAKYAKIIPQDMKFFGDDAMNDLPADKVLMVCTGSQGESRAALTRIASGNHPKVRLNPGDTVIYSSRDIPGNEKDIRSTQDLLIDAGVTVITDDDILTHASGHPNRDELRQMYQWTSPQALIPVHGERSHLREHAAFALESGIKHSIIPCNGDLIEISGNDEPLKVIDQVIHGRLALDGSILVDVRGENLQERQWIMREGVVLVTLILNRAGREMDEIQITQLGLPEVGQHGSILEDLEWTINQALVDCSKSKLRDDEKLIHEIRFHVRRSLKSLLRKKPEVIVHIVR